MGRIYFHSIKTLCNHVMEISIHLFLIPIKRFIILFQIHSWCYRSGCCLYWCVKSVFLSDEIEWISPNDWLLFIITQPNSMQTLNLIKLALLFYQNKNNNFHLFCFTHFIQVFYGNFVLFFFGFFGNFFSQVFSGILLLCQTFGLRFFLSFVEFLFYFSLFTLLFYFYNFSDGEITKLKQKVVGRIREFPLK